MKILGLDCSARPVGVAVTEDGLLLGEYSIYHEKQHSASLLPLMDELAGRIQLDLATVDAIALTEGPGSFTGIRIGAVTAKGLGMVLDKPLVPVSTVEALAWNLWGCAYDVCPLMDARRNQTYTGIYRFSGETVEEVRATCAVTISEIMESVNDNGREVVFLGDGVPVFADYIAENCRVACHFAPVHMNRQRPASVAACGEYHYRRGRGVSSDAFVPSYYRMAQAERERMEAEQRQTRPEESSRRAEPGGQG